MRRWPAVLPPAARPRLRWASLALISGCLVKDDERCARDPAGGADEALQLMTRDDVCLSADLYAGGDEVGVLLVHPDGEAAQDWDPALVSCLGELGTVLAIDRRGAGGSEANPAGAPDDEVRRGDRARDVVDEGDDFDLGKPSLPVRLFDRFGVLSALVYNRELVPHEAEPTDSLGHALVQRPRALASAEHEHAEACALRHGTWPESRAKGHAIDARAALAAE